jgi:myo-inositol 2-dehydrogenase / D-chiro-inositol 1-dehydrogenase
MRVAVLGAGRIGSFREKLLNGFTVLPTEGPFRDFMERFGESLRQETMAFIEVMRDERENPSPPASAMEALRVAVACEVSRKEGRPVRVADVS